MATYLIASVIFLLFAAVASYLYRQHKTNGGCCTGCAGCPNAGSCQQKKTE